MDASTQTHRLATLIVDVLGIGTRGADRMAAGVCAAFGIDLSALLDAQASFDERDRDATRRAVLATLSMAPSPEALARVFLQEGTAVVAMVDEIYQLLATRGATTAGTSESFRLSLDGQDLDVPISSAFIERVRSVLHQLIRVERGRIDLGLLQQFLLFDNGESYGSFATDTHDSRPLLHEIMLLSAVEDELRVRAAADPSFTSAVDVCVAARSAADRLLLRLEQLVTAHAAALLDERARDHSAEESPARYEQLERETLLAHGVIGGPAMSMLFDNLESDEFIGLQVADGDPLTLRFPPAVTQRKDLVECYGGVMSTVAAYLGIVRSGLTPCRDRWGSRGPVRSRALAVEASTPDPVVTWLKEVAGAAEAATVWIDSDVWRPTGESETLPFTQRALEEFLNLPLWREREKLFEVWVVCHTISTCETQGWQAELEGMEHSAWILPGQAAQRPVATLYREQLTLNVWREPDRRGTTPDVTLTTPEPGLRDLVVIEAKDRVRMPTGLAAQGEPDPRTAVASGLKYVRALGPPLTWVLNHGSFRGGIADPERNEGSAWHDLRLAAEVAPGSMPAAFTSTLGAALRPPAVQPPPSCQHRRELVLVLDTTASMDRATALIGGVLDRLTPLGWEYSALLVGDHGEDYVLRSVGVQETPSQLREAAEREPRTHGGDEAEALEDAIRRAAWQATGAHQVFVVASDAPPHPAPDCPDGIELADEVERLLSSGANLWVLSDFLGSSISVWEPFLPWPNFALVNLTDLPARLDELHEAR